MCVSFFSSSASHKQFKEINVTHTNTLSQNMQKNGEGGGRREQKVFLREVQYQYRHFPRTTIYFCNSLPWPLHWDIVWHSAVVISCMLTGDYQLAEFSIKPLALGCLVLVKYAENISNSTGVVFIILYMVCKSWDQQPRNVLFN